MKKSFFKIISILLAVAMVLTMSSCTFYERKNKDLSYYKDIKNYVKATGTVSEIIVNDNADDNDPSLLCKINDNDSEFLYFREFEIVGDNWALVKERGILDKLHEGDQIDFITSKVVIGPSVVRPIVELSVNGEELLSLKEGYNNYIEYIKSRSIFDF